MALTYVMQKGDTLHRLARRYAVRIESIYAENPGLQTSGYVYPGQVIRIPERPDSLYVVQAGDTLRELSRRFNIALTDLQTANPGVDHRRLRIGQTIVLPESRGLTAFQTADDYGYAELVENITRLKSAYPFLEVCDIGVSVLGKRIPAIRIGCGAQEVHYNGAVHANEWITTPLLMKFIEDYASAYACGENLRGRSMEELYEKTSLWVVPMVNPDGVELVQEGITPQHPFYEQLLEWNFGSFHFQRWKANVRGVDLNDQFPAHWEIERDRRDVPGPGPRDYPGLAPLTEPEAIALAQFTRCHDFCRVIAFHSQGQEIYWNYRGLEPVEAEEIACRLGKASGYKPVKLTGSDAGYKDWFIQEYRRPGFTVEVGLGTNPLPVALFPQLYDEVVGLMIEGLHV
ncbi:M14 family metallopeptidase [Paenibacillus hamazuiensis]|uniref:M14 family metallopeptidase n=1 Tax=Paenibacillus hamazuiensis TaxID=2936508 RepID=UPI00200E055A|nr:M14 family metallopeptidase [Paenibacillus hamazuiensis]